ncbi:unnamed protein product [Adineta steineri]|uniref:Uncharacterized protein n=1 Tax=Adineta steineri TaxID=433720 RepID=A0A819FVF9_9BILA|nr:unnamed protein product [Adineta steineri]CAF4063614.1 unnamed protein product [Adineta steineri]
MKLYEIRGAHFHHESQTTRFCLYAPNARNVYLILTTYDPVSFSVVSNQITRQVQSVVHDDNVYIWNDQNWMQKRAQCNPLKLPLSIYEIQPKS